MEVSENKASMTNQSSEKLLRVMEVLSEQDAPIRLSDLAAALDMNISTVSRFLSALQNSGYITQDPDTNRYSMTFKICQIANNVASRMDLRGICLPYLRQISRNLGCASNLITRFHYSVIYMEVVPGPQQLLAPLQRIGKVAPLYCTGAGKLLLQAFNEEQMEEYIREVTFERFTEHTICSGEKLKAAVRAAAEKGYAVDDEECEPGTRCLAVPIYDYTGSIHAAVSVNAPVSKLTDSYIQEHVSELIEIAEEISVKIGYRNF